MPQNGFENDSKQPRFIFRIDPEFSNSPKDILNTPQIVFKQAQNYLNRPTFIFK